MGEDAKKEVKAKATTDAKQEAKVEKKEGGKDETKASKKVAEPKGEEDASSADAGKEAASKAGKEAPLKPVAKPDNAAKDAQVGAISDKIESLLADRSKLEKQQNAHRTGNKPYNDKKREMVTRLKELRQKRRELMDGAKAIQDRVADLIKKDQDKRKKERAAKDALKFTSVEEVDSHLAKLERRHESAQLTKDEEKAIMKEVATLKATRRKVAEFIANKAATADATDIPMLKTEMKTKRTAADEFKAEIEELSTAVDKLSDANKETQSKANKFQAQRIELQEEINVLFKQRDELKKQHNVEWQKFKTYMDAFSKQRDEERRENEVKYKQERAERERLQDEEEAKKKPWEEEIALCDFLVIYLNGKAGKKTGGDDATPAPVASAAPARQGADAAAFAGLQSIGKKADMDDFLVLGGSSKKKSKGKKAKKKDERLTHSMDLIGSFSHLSLTAPTKVDGIDAAIKALEEKKAYYDVLPRAPRKGKASKKEGKKDGDDSKADAGSEPTSDAPGGAAPKDKKQAPKKKPAKISAPAVDSSELFPSLPGAKSPRPQPVTPTSGPSAVDLVKSNGAASAAAGTGSAAPDAAGVPPAADGDPTPAEAST